MKSIPTMWAIVKDAGTGMPVSGAYVHGQYHWGAFIGSGTNAFQGKTGPDGRFPITVSGGWAGDMQADFDYSVEASGYLASSPQQQHIGGITGDFGLNPVFLDKVQVGTLVNLLQGGSGDRYSTLPDDIGRQVQGGGQFVSSLGVPAATMIIIMVIGTVIALVTLAVLLR